MGHVSLFLCVPCDLLLKTGYLKKWLPYQSLQTGMGDFTNQQVPEPGDQHKVKSSELPRSFLGLCPVWSCVYVLSPHPPPSPLLLSQAVSKCLNFPRSLTPATSQGLRCSVIFLCPQSLAPRHLWICSAPEISHAMVPTTSSSSLRSKLCHHSLSGSPSNNASLLDSPRIGYDVTFSTPCFLTEGTELRTGPLPLDFTVGVGQGQVRTSQNFLF